MIEPLYHFKIDHLIEKNNSFIKTTYRLQDAHIKTYSGNVFDFSIR